MKFCNRQIIAAPTLFFISIVFVLCLPGRGFAKSQIIVEPDRCEIYVMVNKEFRIVSVGERDRQIRELDNDINELENWLQGAKADLDAGIPFNGMDMAASQANYDQAKEGKDALVDQKKKLEDANAEDRAIRPGLSQADINAQINKWDKEVEDLWNGPAPYMFNCCRVRFLYNYRWREEGDPPTPGYDQVSIHLAHHFRSSVGGFTTAFDVDGFSDDPYDGDMDANFRFYPREGYTIPHEAGHEMGIDDYYREEKQPDGTIVSRDVPGHENDIMNGGGTPVSTGADGVTKVDHINTILTKRHIVCPQPGCCPAPEPPPAPDVPAGHAGDPVGPAIEIGCRGGDVLINIYSPDGRLMEPVEMDGSASGDFVAVLDRGRSIEDAKRMAAEFKGSLLGPDRCRKADDVIKDTPGVDFIDRVLERDVQQGVKPNDPFYLDIETYEKKKKKGQTIIDILPKPEKDSVPGGIYADKKKRVIGDQWGMHAVGFTPLSDPDSAWNLVDFDKENVIVAVIDSGLDLTHPDGPKYLWKNSREVPGNGKDDDGNGYIDDVYGWNFADENSDLTDYKGHGTFVTGIIAARANNSIAIAGINPGARIMVLKTVNKDGKANNLNIYRALRYAADNGARVINVSLAGKGVSKLEQRGIDYAQRKGCVVVIAAGNHSGEVLEYGPPASKGALVISAAEPGGERMWFSNIGANIALTAPGLDVFSLYSRDSQWLGPEYKKKNLCFSQDGTSFAAPYVSGTASLLFAKNPNLTNLEAEDILLDSATDLENPGWDQYTGAGFLNAAKALSSIGKNIMTVRFTGLTLKTDSKGKIESVDVYGLVRGNLAGYKVELGKGKKRPSGWKKVLESTDSTGPDGIICHIDGLEVKYGQDWTIRITAQDKAGNIKTADLWFSTQ